MMSYRETENKTRNQLVICSTCEKSMRQYSFHNHFKACHQEEYERRENKGRVYLRPGVDYKINGQDGDHQTTIKEKEMLRGPDPSSSQTNEGHLNNQDLALKKPLNRQELVSLPSGYVEDSSEQDQVNLKSEQQSIQDTKGQKQFKQHKDLQGYQFEPTGKVLQRRDGKQLVEKQMEKGHAVRSSERAPFSSYKDQKNQMMDFEAKDKLESQARKHSQQQRRSQGEESLLSFQEYEEEEEEEDLPLYRPSFYQRQPVRSIEAFQRFLESQNNFTLRLIQSAQQERKELFSYGREMLKVHERTLNLLGQQMEIHSSKNGFHQQNSIRDLERIGPNSLIRRPEEIIEDLHSDLISQRDHLVEQQLEEVKEQKRRAEENISKEGQGQADNLPEFQSQFQKSFINEENVNQSLSQDRGIEDLQEKVFGERKASRDFSIDQQRDHHLLSPELLKQVGAQCSAFRGNGVPSEQNMKINSPKKFNEEEFIPPSQPLSYQQGIDQREIINESNQVQMISQVDPPQVELKDKAKTFGLQQETDSVVPGELNNLADQIKTNEEKNQLKKRDEKFIQKQDIKDQKQSQSKQPLQKEEQKRVGFGALGSAAKQSGSLRSMTKGKPSLEDTVSESDIVEPLTSVQKPQQNTSNRLPQKGDIVINLSSDSDSKSKKLIPSKVVQKISTLPQQRTTRKASTPSRSLSPVSNYEKPTKKTLVNQKNSTKKTPVGSKVIKKPVEKKTSIKKVVAQKEQDEDMEESEEYSDLLKLDFRDKATTPAATTLSQKTKVSGMNPVQTTIDLDRLFIQSKLPKSKASQFMDFVSYGEGRESLGLLDEYQNSSIMTLEKFLRFMKQGSALGEEKAEKFMKVVFKDKCLSSCYSEFSLLRIVDSDTFIKAFDMKNEQEVMIRVPQDSKGLRDIVTEWDSLQHLYHDCLLDASFFLEPLCLLHDVDNCQKGLLVSAYDSEFITLYDFKAGISRSGKKREQRFGEEQQLQVLQNLAVPIKAIHNEKYAHNNLTCWNVLVDPKSLEVKITDFSCSAPMGSSILPKGNPHFSNSKILEMEMKNNNNKSGLGKGPSKIEYLKCDTSTDYYHISVLSYLILEKDDILLSSLDSSHLDAAFREDIMTQDECIDEDLKVAIINGLEGRGDVNDFLKVVEKKNKELSAQKKKQPSRASAKTQETKRK